MIKFIRYYSLEIYSVISILFLLIASLIGDLSFTQKAALIYTVLFLLHEWEERVYPGGFFDKFSEVLDVESNEELRRITRVEIYLLSGLLISNLIERLVTPLACATLLIFIYKSLFIAQTP